MQEFLQTGWFLVGGQEFTFGDILGALSAILALSILYWYVTKRVFSLFLLKTLQEKKEVRKVHRITTYLFYLALLLSLMLILDIDWVLYSTESIKFKVSLIFQALLIFQIARMLDWVISRIFIHSYFSRRDKPRTFTPQRRLPEESASRTVQFAVYILAFILILQRFQIDYTLLRMPDNNGGEFELKISNIFIAIFVILVARLVIWVITQIFLYAYYKKENVDTGTQFAFNQLLKYVIYTISIVIAIQYLGVNPTLVWGGLAALAVGIGLGLQQTFNDFFSGIILLFERSVEIGDVLEVDGMVGTVKRIGIRASIVETLENVSVIVPNSKLVTQNVINWSHYDNKVRFFLTVGVAYGSETERVREILVKVAREHDNVLDLPPPFVRFVDFANSSLNFELHFWSKRFIRIEDIKSQLRFIIDQEFRNADIRIPFPQQDIWIRSENGGSTKSESGAPFTHPV